MNSNLIVRLAYYVATQVFLKDLNKIIDIINEHKGKSQQINISLLMILQVAEDKRFAEHCGFDLWAILRALTLFMIKGERSGASTIDQQLVRTITQNRERTIYRKLKEIILASAMNFLFDKTTIARVYLLLAYYGWNMEGIDAAFFRLREEGVFGEKDFYYGLVSLLKYPLPRFLTESRLLTIQNRIAYIKRRKIIVGAVISPFLVALKSRA